MKTSAARLAVAAIAAAVAVIASYLTAVFAVAALGPDGTAYDVLGAIACAFLAAMAALLAWRGTR